MMIIIKKKVRKTWFLVTNRMLPSLLLFMFNDCSVCVCVQTKNIEGCLSSSSSLSLPRSKKMKQKIIFRSSFRLYGWVHIVETFEFFCFVLKIIIYAIIVVMMGETNFFLNVIKLLGSITVIIMRVVTGQQVNINKLLLLLLLASGSVRFEGSF